MQHYCVHGGALYSEYSEAWQWAVQVVILVAVCTVGKKLL